jgi:hypothetical protein
VKTEKLKKKGGIQLPPVAFEKIEKTAGVFKQNQSPPAAMTAQNSAKTAKKIGRPFQKGKSGNPGGRPKRTPLADACREVLTLPVLGDPEGRTYAEKIAATLAEKAAKGDIRAAGELADRAEGKPRQSVEIENTTLRQAFGRMSDPELDAYARDGRLPTWFPRPENETVQ